MAPSRAAIPEPNDSFGLHTDDVTRNTITIASARVDAPAFFSPTLGQVSALDLPIELRRALAAVARAPRLLVASDYDGTLSPIMSDPDKAVPHAEAVRALRGLAVLPRPPPQSSPDARSRIWQRFHVCPSRSSW